MSKLFLSHRLDLLAEYLAEEIAKDGLGVFVPRIIVVPNSSLKQWILIQIANWTQAKGIAGCKAVTLQEATQTYLAPSSFTKIFFSLFYELADSHNLQIRSYLDQSPRRIVELADCLAKLIVRYGNFCPSLFEPDPTTKNWQKQLIQKLFVSGDLRLPVQMPPLADVPIHCFGFDYLPPALWRAFSFRSIYLFSPCCHFWEDLCTDRERKKLRRYWKLQGASEKRREELDEYLKNAPSLLANWGKGGREALKVLDSFVEEIEEDYSPVANERNSSLSRLRARLLHFEIENSTRYSEDSSIQIAKTGSSPLREIEHLRLSILRLMQEERLLGSDIVVLAPDIQPYVSLIQFVFSDLPYRISGLQIGSKSFFYQAMHRFFELNFDAEDLMALFENPAFCKARGWDLGILEKIRGWLIDDKELEVKLLDQFVYLLPEEGRRISNVSADVLEEFIEIYQSFRSDHATLQEPRTLTDWSKLLMSMMQKYFSVDLSDEADAAAWSFFKESMKELTEADSDARLVPFAPIQALLKRSIPGGQIHAAHLHAIRFGSIAEGSLTPVRALFLIGMDEESFPRRSSLSSLDLVRLEKVYPFDPVDQDRYLFLQALFSAKEFLRFSYSHLSPEGNPVNPSPLIEELIRNLDAPIEELLPERKAFLRSGNGRQVSCRKSSDSSLDSALKDRDCAELPVQESKLLPPAENSKPMATFHWPEAPSQDLPEGEWTIALSDLSSLARHPWEFYLKKQFGVRFQRAEEESFSLQKAKILKAHLQKPIQDLLSDLPKGICGEAMKIDLDRVSEDWSHSIRSWDVLVEPVFFRICCNKKKKLEKGWEFPCMELNIAPTVHVKLVGNVKNFSTKGYIHTGNDNLEGLLRVWPECLAALVSSGQREIYCLKSGKIKKVERPLEALQAYIVYYFLSQTAPSPLLTDWADSILRKGPADWEKKMRDKLLAKGTRFEDPVWDWVIDRVTLPSAAIWFEKWGQPLQELFTELTAMYPSRSKYAAV